MRSTCVAIILMILAFASAGRVVADVVPDLYRGEAIVTGQNNLEERARGVREALAQVLVKASGDAGLAADPRLPALLAEADGAVVGLDYEDRLAKKKLMDEQGTRERSYLLRVDFAPAKVDAMLATLGRKPWPADRPRILVLLAVRDLVGDYVLATDSPRGWGQREALADSARRLGLPVVLPASAGLAGVAWADLADVADARAPALASLRAAAGAQAMLAGAMVITPDGVWNTDWWLVTDDARRPLSVPAASFDQALRDGLAFTAGTLAGAR